MLLPPHKVTDVAREMLQLLQKNELIETDLPREVQLDLEAVLNQYIKTEQELITRARQTIDSRGLTNRDFGRVLNSLAEQKGVKVGDEEGMDYLLEQLLQMVLNSSNIEEIYAEDHEIRRELRIPLRKQGEQREKVEREVRASQIPQIEEGSPVWEIEYQKMMEDIRRRRGL